MYRIEFEKKVKKYRNRLSLGINYAEKVNLYIDRKYLLYDAYDQIIEKNTMELKKRLNIVYKEEDGVDAGGLLR